MATTDTVETAYGALAEIAGAPASGVNTLVDQLAVLSTQVVEQRELIPYATTITTGVKGFWRAPCTFVLDDIQVLLADASDTGDVTVDTLVDGSTVFDSTVSTVPEGEVVSDPLPTLATVPTVVDEGAQIRWNVTGAGATAAGMVVTVYGHRVAS